MILWVTTLRRLKAQKPKLSFMDKSKKNSHRRRASILWKHSVWKQCCQSHIRNHKKSSHCSMGALPDYWGWSGSGSAGLSSEAAARHTLSHATSSQPTAIPTPDDTPLSRPIFVAISGIFWPVFVVAITTCLFPIHCISLLWRREQHCWRIGNGHCWQVRGPLQKLQTTNL